MTHAHPLEPHHEAPDMSHVARGETALPPRIGYTVLLLVGVGIALGAGSLSLGEPDIPDRTRWALGAVAGAGAAWALFAGWVLARRRILFARHRVVAAAMGVVFSALFTGGAWVVGMVAPGLSVAPALALGLMMLVVALLQLRRAIRTMRRLRGRRRELEELLAGGDASSVNG